jgi:hypothetical protein
MEVLDNFVFIFFVLSYYENLFWKYSLLGEDISGEKLIRELPSSEGAESP